MAAGWRGAELRLVGAGGEPADLRRTLDSHGLTSLAPYRLEETVPALEATLPQRRGAPRTVRISPGRAGRARVELLGPAVSQAAGEALLATVRHMLRLDEDLSPFYALVDGDEALGWVVTAGAGRLFRSPTVFEDVVKTICTTNCAWSATVRMSSALVEHLGEPSPDGRRAFPAPAAMAAADESFYRDAVRAGYRGAYLRSLAASVAEGSLDLEALNDPDLADDEVRERLLALPGVGPYAAAHVMILLGRYRPLVLDSWTRPRYAALGNGGKPVPDARIDRAFARRYKRYAGLAFWLFLTRDWVPEPVP